MDGSRRLVVVRHAKSAWPDLPDHDRPLAKRGRRDAPRAGAWLRNAGHIPDLVLCSTARRARETWQLAAETLGVSPPVRYEARLYGADLAALLAVIAEQPADAATLLVVGHDPSVQQLTLHLAKDRTGDAIGELVDRVRTKFPTCAIAVLAISGPWTELDQGSARLTNFVLPREGFC